MKTNEKIKLKRKEKSFTQKQLAEETGIAEITIRKYEKGDRTPKLDQLTKIAAVLNCSPIELLDDEASIFEKWDAKYNSPQLSQEVKALELISMYEQLNEVGKGKAREYIRDLLKLYKGSDSIGFNKKNE